MSKIITNSILRSLENDITRNPERLRAIGADLVARLKVLVGEVEIDLTSPLRPDETPEEQPPK